VTNWIDPIRRMLVGIELTILGATIVIICASANVGAGQAFGLVMGLIGLVIVLSGATSEPPNPPS
jgi:hypothetical protein